MQLTNNLFRLVPSCAQCGSKREKTNLVWAGTPSEHGDYKLDILSPLAPVLPGVPVHITQNAAPKLWLGNGSTRTVVGYQFPLGTILKSMSFQECPMILSPKPAEIIYVSIDQARFRNRSLGFPEGFPDENVSMAPFSLGLASKNFRVTITKNEVETTLSIFAHLNRYCEKICTWTRYEGRAYGTVPESEPGIFYIHPFNIMASKQFFPISKLEVCP